MLKINDYNEEFNKLKNRGKRTYYKYEPAKINFDNDLINAIETMNSRIAKYKETSNTEYLLNFASYL